MACLGRGLRCPNASGSLSLRFSGHLSGWTWVSLYQNVSILDFIGARMLEVVVITGAIRRAKFQSNRHQQQINSQLFLQAGCPSCRPSISVKALKGRDITFHGLAHLRVDHHCLWPLKAAGYLKGRIAKPLVSRLTPVSPECVCVILLLLVN